jgi:hypothetical protein
MCFFEVEEMMFESIPGSVLQTYAIFSSYDDREWVQIVSLFASALAVGAISSRMSFYIDVSPKSREKAGNFYGYVPDSQIGQFIIQVAMMLITVCQLLGRSLAYALIAVSFGTTYAMLAVVLELALYFAYKLLLGDFYYQAVRLHGIMCFVGSVLIRLIVKIITDL